MNNVKVALSNDLLKAFSRLPKAQQKKVREWIEKFQLNPRSPGINFERINNAKDPKVRSVRIDGSYRAILAMPEKGNVVLLAWVDNHEQAYAWAMNRRFDVNPTTGSLQVYTVVESEEIEARENNDDAEIVREGRLFSGMRFKELRRIGVPELLLPSVAAMYSEHDLDEFSTYLPQEALDALYMIAAGMEIDEALREVENEFYAKVASEPVDVNDFAAALEHPDSKQRFVVIENDEALSQVLNASLEQWRVFLHPSQRRVVEKNYNGPCRVLGGAGTGKTVALLHRTKFLAEKIFTADDDKILVTTYTANLAAELKKDLEKICNADAYSRIEVANLHSWAFQVVKAQGKGLKIASNADKNKIWASVFDEEELELPKAFYTEEWSKVIQAQGIIDKRGYFLARRKGRGTPMTRKKRATAWKVFSAFRSKLDERRESDWGDLIHEARRIIEERPKGIGPCAVLTDEVQDLHEGELRLIRAIVPEGPNDLFLVGDGHQRIYGHKTSMLQCGIDIRGRGKRLKKNYRTTAQISRWSVALLKGVEIDDLAGGSDDLRGYHSVRHGEAPRVQLFNDVKEECDVLVTSVKSYLAENGHDKLKWICVSARSERLLGTYRKALESAGFSIANVKRDSVSELGEGIRIATMHRMKGLEFPCVILCGVQEGTVPSEPANGYGDEISKKDHLIGERCLMYVSATRARDRLFVFGNGGLSELIPIESQNND